MKRIESPIWRKVVFCLVVYGIGFVVSCAIMGTRFNIKESVLVTVVLGTLLLIPVLLIVLARWTIQGAVALSRSTTPPSTFVKMMVIGPVLTIAMTLGLFWSVHSRQERCDKLAAENLSSLSAAVERLGNELKDLGCADLRQQFSEEHIKYLAGPYYGWRGTNAWCKVLVRIEKGELRGCAIRGTRPADNREHRKIFRAAIFGNQQLDSLVGACKGMQYGYFPDRYYFSSMVLNKDGQHILHEPAELEMFKQYRDDYQRELSKQRQK